jgi:hypothetical protein
MLGCWTSFAIDFHCECFSRAPVLSIFSSAITWHLIFIFISSTRSVDFYLLIK